MNNTINTIENGFILSAVTAYVVFEKQSKL